MDGIVLYTPGHNLVTDSLIMHGIVRYLTWADVNIDSVKIRGLGERFIIEIGKSNSTKEDRGGGGHHVDILCDKIPRKAVHKEAREG